MLGRLARATLMRPREPTRADASPRGGVAVGGQAVAADQDGEPPAHPSGMIDE